MAGEKKKKIAFTKKKKPLVQQGEELAHIIIENLKIKV